MSEKHLTDALNAIDWKANVSAFLADKPLTVKLANANLRVAIWAKQFEAADNGNCALPFIREMQASSQEVAALVALGLYQSAATASK